MAGRHGFGTAETAEALLDADIDALVIAAPTASHAELLGLAARGGVATFCEKPVALELEAVDAVMDEVDRAGILVQIGFQRRFDAGYRAAHDAVSAGGLGTLLLLRAATHDPAPPPEAYIATSGGIFRDLQVHDIDAIRFVTGEDVVEVYADGAVRETDWFGRLRRRRRRGRRSPALRRDARDPLRDAPGPARVRRQARGLRDLGQHRRRRSTRGARCARSSPGVAAPGAPGYRDFIDRFGAAYRSELAAFVDTVRRGGESLCSLADARTALAVAVAADRSRAERRPIAIEEVASAEPVST